MSSFWMSFHSCPVFAHSRSRHVQFSKPHCSSINSLFYFVGKPHSNDSCNSLMAQRCPRNDSTKMTSSSLEQEPKPVKPTSEPVKPTSAPAKPIEPTVNLIQVKRKPGPAAPATATVVAPKPAPKEVEKEKEKESKTSPLTFKKKRSGRVILVKCLWFFQNFIHTNPGWYPAVVAWGRAVVW